MRLLLLLLSLQLTAGLQAAPLYESSYTPLSEASCRTIDVDETGIATRQQCPGFGKYGVIVIETDLRQSITLTRNGREYPLAFWRTVSPAWSILGNLVEWRHTRLNPGNPVAMIVRLNVSENPVDPDDMSSYLVVGRISDTGICVVGKIPPVRGGQQNRLAREMADNAAALPCTPGSLSSGMRITP
jgi:hypothetical protein